VNFVDCASGRETKCDVSYMNYYEARYIVALLDFINTVIEHKRIQNKDDLNPE